jgi:hypothetical protein
MNIRGLKLVLTQRVDRGGLQTHNAFCQPHSFSSFSAIALVILEKSG